MLDSVNHMTLKLIKSENIEASSYFMQHYNGHHYLPLQNLQTTSGLSFLLHGVISLLDTMSCDNRYLCSREWEEMEGSHFRLCDITQP